MPLMTNVSGEDKDLCAVGMSRTLVESGASVDVPQDVFDGHAWPEETWQRADIDSDDDDPPAAPRTRRTRREG